MSQTQRNVILSLVIVLVVAGIIFALKQKSSGNGDNSTSTSTDQFMTAFLGQTPTLGTTTVNPDSTTYSSPDGAFTFNYPKSFTSNTLDQTSDANSNGQTTVFHGSGPKDNFQIYTVPFDNSPITPERVKADIPDFNVENNNVISVDGAQGVAFYGVDAQSHLKTREIWFSHNSVLYQITTYPEFDTQMATILASWKWLAP